MSKCLYCYRELNAGDQLLHSVCIRRVFSAAGMPKFPYDSKQIEENMARDLVVDRADGVLKFVDGVGQYTLSSRVGESALMESVAMRMAEVSRIAVVPHTLLMSEDREYYHLRRSIEHGKRRTKIEVSRVSDIEGMGSDISCEGVAELLNSHSTTPKLDVINLYERMIFGYLVGDNSLSVDSLMMAKSDCGCSLAPACSIVPNSLLGDAGDMAMTIGGKCNEFTRADFEGAMLSGGVDEKVIDNIFTKIERSIDEWYETIDSSPLSEESKDAFKFQLVIRFDTL